MNRRIHRQLAVVALCMLTGITLIRWHRSASIDPLLVGRWEWSPDPTAGFPMQFDGDGSGEVTVTMGCCAFTRSCRWKVDDNELQIHPAPQLENLTVAGARAYLSDLWKSVVTSPQPVRRYRIVERTSTDLRLQPLWSDGSVSDEAVEVYRRAVENPLESSLEAASAPTDPLRDRERADSNL